MEQFLPIIVIALISFFVNRASEQKKRTTNREKSGGGPNHRPVQPRQQERPMPSPTKTAEQEKPEPDITEKPRSLKEAAEILLSQMQPQIEEKKAVVENKIDELQKEAEVYKKRAHDLQRKVEAVKEKKEEKAADPHLEPFFQQNDIVKGIIMTEVLGPPRSKRRYGQR